MDELKLDMDEILDPVQRMTEHLQIHYPGLNEGEKVLLAAQLVQCSLLQECLRRLVSLEQKSGA